MLLFISFVAAHSSVVVAAAAAAVVVVVVVNDVAFSSVLFGPVVFSVFFPNLPRVLCVLGGCRG